MKQEKLTLSKMKKLYLSSKDIREAGYLGLIGGCIVMRNNLIPLGEIQMSEITAELLFKSQK